MPAEVLGSDTRLEGGREEAQEHNDTQYDVPNLYQYSIAIFSNTSIWLLMRRVPVVSECAFSYDLHCTFSTTDMYKHTVINNCSVFIKFMIWNMVAATPDIPKSQEWQIQLEY